MNLNLIGVILYLHIKGVYNMSCDKGWLEFEGKCYIQYNAQVDWNSAFLTCAGNDVPTQLVTVDSEELSTFLLTNVTNEERFWIGLGFGKRKLKYSEISGNAWNWNYNIDTYNWTWSDGTHITYSDWTDASVISACVAMTNNQTWYTRNCTLEGNFVCEKEMFSHSGGPWLAHNSHSYLFVDNVERNCTASALFCFNEGGYILSINNQEEANFVYEVISKNTGTEYWIGLSPLSWADDTPYKWNNWDDNGPNMAKKCTFMDRSTGTWSAGDCDTKQKYRFICQRDAVVLTTTEATTFIDETGYTYAYFTDTTPKTKDAVVLTTIEATTFINETGYTYAYFTDTTPKTKGFPLTSVVPAVTGVVVFTIIIIVVVVVFLRRKRSPQKTTEDQVPTNKMDEYDTSLDVYDAIDPTLLTDKPISNIPSTNAHGQETIIYDTTETGQGPASTIVVNGDVYAIVDKDKPGNNKMKDNNNTIHDITKNGISKGQSHIVVGTDVYAIVDKEKVKQNKQNRQKQKKKKTAPPPKLEDELDEINSIGQNHIVVGSDVYAIVDKDKATPNNQNKPKQKKKPETPPKLEGKADKIISNGQNHVVVGSDVYAIVDKDKVTLNNQKKPKQKKKKPETPPKLEDKSDKISSNRQNPIVVGSDVYAIVDKDKVTPNTQKKLKQMKKKPETPPELEDTEEIINEGNVYYNEFNLKAPPIGPTEHNMKTEKQTENGVVYADIDLTGSVSGNNQDRSYDEESGVVYADVRG